MFTDAALMVLPWSDVWLKPCALEPNAKVHFLVLMLRAFARFPNVFFEEFSNYSKRLVLA